jgi:hypothetical protein
VDLLYSLIFRSSPISHDLYCPCPFLAKFLLKLSENVVLLLSTKIESTYFRSELDSKGINLPLMMQYYRVLGRSGNLGVIIPVRQVNLVVGRLVFRLVMIFLDLGVGFKSIIILLFFYLWLF